MTDVQYGTEDDDTLGFRPGSFSNDEQITHGLGGNDHIQGGIVGDTLYGDNGNDTIVGNSGGAMNEYGDDFLYGGFGNDTLDGDSNFNDGSGGGGNDTLSGEEGDDIIRGHGGNDTLYAGTGGDFLDGGAGNDKVYADGSAADRYDFLYGSAGDDVYYVDGDNIGFRADGYDGGHDRIEISASLILTYSDGTNVVEIEDIKLTGAGAFEAVGNSLDNVIQGNNAANTLRGMSGADTLFGNDGNDTLDGGVGYVDILRGGRNDDTYIVGDLDDIWEDVGQGHDTVQSSIRWVLSDNFEDLVLTGTASVNGFGNSLANTLTGNSGNNYFNGGTAFDLFQGGAGNDYYELGDLIDRQFLGWTYDSVIEGVNAGVDTVSVTSIDNPDAPFSTNHYTLGANLENGIIVGALNFNLAGNELNNALTGNDAVNTLTGNGGNDRLDGNAGLDTLIGGAGDDTYILDDLTFIDDQTGSDYDKVVEAANGGIDTVYVSPLGNARYFLDANIENVLVSGGAGLYVAGNDLANQFTGNAGNNQLYGEGGNDRMNGGAGIDQLYGGLGDDIFILADANVFGGSLQFDTVGEDANGGIDTVQVSSTVGRLTYVLDANVENAEVTGAANFNLVGNILGNRLSGNEVVNQLSGGDGNDVLVGRGGADALIGGIGSDTASYETNLYLSGVTASLVNPSGNTGDAAGDTYSSIENLLGSFYNDVLIGNAAANRISGGAGGDDRLIGGAGADYLSGGAGSDTASYETAAAGLIVSLANPAINTGEAAGDTFNSIENLVGSGFDDGLNGNAGINVVNGGIGADSVKGYAGSDKLFGGDGNDTLAGGTGADYLSGGTGNDTASYLGATSGVTVSLANPAINTGEAAGDTFNSIENLIGAGFNDGLNGNAAANVLNGGGGNDAIKGYAGNDTLTGGAGSDRFIFNTAANSTTNFDHITDFNVAADTVCLDNAIFLAVGANGALASAAFYAGTAAHDASDRVIYNPATGNVAYDADGIGAAAAIRFASLDTGLALTNADFAVL